MIKVSIIIAVLDSHEIVRRQFLHFKNVGIPDEAELILLDDGSEVPITSGGVELKNAMIVRTYDKRPWTWAIARNLGAKIARGSYVFMTDIDYIISRSAMEDAIGFDGDRMGFKREFGILDENGVFSQDIDTLLSYGLDPTRIPNRGVKLAPHPNNFVMRKDLFWEMGGYREDRVGWPYPQGEDRHFKKTWLRWVAKGKAVGHDYRPTIYMFPNGQYCGDIDHNPFGLFHNLSRKNEGE